MQLDEKKMFTQIRPLESFEIRLVWWIFVFLFTVVVAVVVAAWICNAIRRWTHRLISTRMPSNLISKTTTTTPQIVYFSVRAWYVVCLTCMGPNSCNRLILSMVRVCSTNYAHSRRNYVSQYRFLLKKKKRLGISSMWLLYTDFYACALYGAW